MAATSTMLELGTALPEFQLFSIQHDAISTSRMVFPNGLLVVFICPHCPYVRHIRTELARFCHEYQARGLVTLAINPNDNGTYPEDGIDGMKKEAEEAGYRFPYMPDETQELAKAFRAACTPDFYLFDRDRKLVYRGQFDSSRPKNGVPVTGSDLRAAADAMLEGRVPSADQKPSMGCSIKWKAGDWPEY